MSSLEPLNQIIYETTRHPFGVSAYNRNEKVSDFVGRKKELHEFKEYIQTLVRSKVSFAIRLEGPAGVGKSTLFNYVKESIERERNDEISLSYYLNENIDVLSAYFQLPGDINSFRDIWKPMFESLAAEFHEETNMDMSFPEYVVYKFIFRCLEQYPEEISDLIWRESSPPKEVKYLTFSDILYPIYDNAERIVKDFRDFYNQNKRKIRRDLAIFIDGQKFELTRSDTEILSKLIGVLDEDDDYLTKVSQADFDEFRNDDELLSFFNTLSRYYTIATKKIPIILIGIDEIAKYSGHTTEDESNYFKNLGNLLIRLRNNLNLVLFVLISTTEDWDNFDRIIEREGDLKGQLQSLIKPIILKQLEIDETIQVFKNRIVRFWEFYPYRKDPSHPYYPFNETFFEYIYRYNARNLRTSIEFLHRIWSNFRFKRTVFYNSDPFAIMRYVRELDGNLINGRNIKRFEWKIIEDYFNQSSYSSSNSARSSAIEKGLEGAWKVLRQDPNLHINTVQNNPTIKTGEGKTRRPDVLLEIAGEMGLDYLRRVEFQVKAYRNKKVSKSEIESSVQLFEEGYTDLLYFVVTGEGFDSQAQFIVDELRKEFPNRILNPVLDKNQELFLIFLALYEEIFDWHIGTSIDHDSITVENVLQVILGRNPRTFLNMVKQLSSRGFIQPPISQPVRDSVISQSPNDNLDNYFGVSDPEEAPPISDNQVVETKKVVSKANISVDNGESWLEDYPFMKPMKYEACSLARYIESRENNKRFRHKFTIATVDKNMIKPNAQLESSLFKDLVKEMHDKNYLTQKKTTYQLTGIGIEWFEKVRNNNFEI